MLFPSNAHTLSTPLMVAVCSVLVRTVYTTPEKAAPRTEPLSTVPLCIHSGAAPLSPCLHMRVSWSEQFPPWSSRETLKAAVRGSIPNTRLEKNLQLLTVHIVDTIDYYYNAIIAVI